MRLKDRVMIVTGGGHGIGLAYCRGFAKEGARVVIAEIDEPAARQAAAELTAQGYAALAVPTDVTSEASTQAMAQAAVEHFGQIDGLVNNAAIFATIEMSRGLIEEISVEEWDRMMAVNLKGTFLATRAVLPYMRRQGRGVIINISSGTAYYGPPGRIHYVTSKAGILGFTRTLARELGPSGIRVNGIAPGSTLSQPDPRPDVVDFVRRRAEVRALPRIEYPEDLVGAAIFLASDESAFITGQTLVVDGGNVMV